MNLSIKLFAVAFVFSNLVFSSISFADCHLGSNGRNYCGDNCELNANGTWSCYNNQDQDDGDDRPVTCHLGSNGRQYCGHDCALNSNGTWSCD